jgi:hypothetical protein
MVETKRTTKYGGSTTKYGGSTAKKGGSSTAKKGGSTAKKGGESCKKGGDIMNNAANLSVPFGLALAKKFLQNVDALKPTEKSPSKRR